MTNVDRGTFHTGVAPAHSSHVVWVDLDGEVVIFDERTNVTVVLNRTASTLWQVFDGTTTLGAIAAEFIATANAPAETIESEIVAVTRQLADRHLLRLDPMVAHDD